MARFVTATIALLLAAGLIVLQLFYGGAYVPFLALPGLGLIAVAAVLHGLAFSTARDDPSASCFLAVAALAGYLAWRIAESPDPHQARADLWLLLGALCVYGIAATGLRDGLSRWLLLGLLFATALVQLFYAVRQYTGAGHLHPLPVLAESLRFALGDPLSAYGFFPRRTRFAGLMTIIAFLSLGQLLWGRGGAPAKLLLSLVSAGAFAGIAISLTRAGYLGALAGLAGFATVSLLVFLRGAQGRHLLLGLGLSAGLAAALAAALWIGAESPVVQIRAGKIGADFYREKLWTETVPPILEKSPLWGTGANTFVFQARRHRPAGLDGDAYYAHNDWIQLATDYGWIGFALGAVFLAVHLLAAFRHSLRIATQGSPFGLLPQSTALGLATGSAGVLSAYAVQSMFDFNLHIPANALLVALAAGFSAGARRDSSTLERTPPLAAAKVLAGLVLVPGLLLAGQVLRHTPGEYRFLQAENALLQGRPVEAAMQAEAGLQTLPDHPFLLGLRGDAAMATALLPLPPAVQQAHRRIAAAHFALAAGASPLDRTWHFKLGHALDTLQRPAEALPHHLRGFALEPNFGMGYYYLGMHYHLQGRWRQAESLYELSWRSFGGRPARDNWTLVREEAIRETGRLP